jgi:hypothetical protein
MSIQHVINWIEGPPAKLEPGMFLLYADGSAHLCGGADHMLIPEFASLAIKHAQLIRGYELDWAASMGIKRELAL